jgi:hypothetical protein
MHTDTYPIEREALRQLHLQIASARFDGAPELARAARRAIRAVKRGAKAVAALDSEAAEVLSYAESYTIRVLRSDELEEAAE